MNIMNPIPTVRAKRSLGGMSRDADGTPQEAQVRRARLKSADDTQLHLGAHRHSKLRGLEQARRDLNDGITAIQTADGAILKMDSALSEMKKLAVEAQQPMTATQRKSADHAFRTARNTLAYLTKETSYRDQTLLDGTAATGVSFRKRQSIDPGLPVITIGDLRPAKLGLTRQNLSSPGQAARALEVVEASLAQVEGQRQALDSMQQELSVSIEDVGHAIEGLIPDATNPVRDREEAQRAMLAIQRQIKQRAGQSVSGQANLTQQTALTLLLR